MLFRSQETPIAEIRKNLPFSDIIFSFPVTQKGTKIKLPAFLSNISDSFSAQWNPQSVYGRADPIPIYRNTTRSISLGFKIPSQSFEDANANFKSLGVLVKNLYPVYKSFGSADSLGSIRDVISGLSPNQSIVGAPLTRIKFANLLCNAENPAMGVLGYISTLGITIETNSGFLIYSVAGQDFLFPRMLNFNMSFTPLHEHKLGWSTSNSWLGQFQNNFPHATKPDGAASLDAASSFNVLGAVVSGEGASINRVLFSPG